jgi:hypothetical protein
MRCVAYSSNDSYKYRLAKTRENVLNDLYERKVVEQKPKRVDNLRLRLRFKEAIQEAQEICELNKDSSECHFAWYEVDELEDAMSRYYPDQR